MKSSRSGRTKLKTTAAIWIARHYGPHGWAPPSTWQYSVHVLATFTTCDDIRSLAHGRHSDTRNGKYKAMRITESVRF